MNVSKNIIMIMGVSGSGKTHIGKMVSKELKLPYIEADAHHPQENIQKMSQQIPLTDEDRWPWLRSLHQQAMAHRENGAVISCSALKKSYRKLLSQNLENKILWVYLKGDFETIFTRMEAREGHYMKKSMLKSQFEALEEPNCALTLDIAKAPELLTKRIVLEWKKSQP